MAWTHIGTEYSGWQNGFRLVARFYLGDQNIEANASQILTETFLEAQSGSWVNASFTGSALAGTWGGGKTAQFSVPTGGMAMFTAYSMWVGHLPDGTASVQIGGSLTANNVITFNQAIAVWYNLPTIPRATTPNTTGGTGFVAGTAQTINLPRASSGFTHDVSYKFGTETGTIATGAGVTASWTPPLSLLTQIPNAPKGTVTITVVTKQGSTVIGTKSGNWDLEAPASVVPTVSAVTWAEQNPTVAAAIGAFVQGVSLIKGTVTAAGAQGSTIVAKSLAIGGQSFTEDATYQPATSGTITAAGSAVDSRGRVGTLSAPFTVLAYNPPQLTQAMIRRATTSGGTVGDGAYLRMDLSAVVSSLKPSTTEKNALKLLVRTRPVGGSWTTRNNVTHSALSYSNALVMVSGGAVYLTTTSYDVEITISDNAGKSAVILQRVGTASAALDLSGNAAGIGKIWERGTLDVGGDAYAATFRADAEVYSRGDGIVSPVGEISAFAGTTAPAGWLLCQGQAVSRTTYAALFAVLGTAYGAGDGSTTFNLPNAKGRALIGLDPADTDFDTRGKSGGTKTHTLTTAEMPSHRHSTDTEQGGGWNGGWGGGNPLRSNGPSYTEGKWGSYVGGGGAHNNLSPYLVANYIIRY